ncbi:aminopeptidase Ey-like [Protopterus annectens]|uniref:aminopeptidase Ey-like n=1 Tax=Protopterus annectens TaxID=7888 RepID=UPI001CFB500B|nr:aminopeptidase Ey-like [Protopterus annectens]XP_043934239.1 aminopeptidase Ey-like [Protopterus annectens]XP_043934240.1 aminopeptidase Ey-like [Protopterus annectens]
MARGYYISQTLAAVTLLLAVISVALNIGLGLLYVNEKAKHQDKFIPTQLPTFNATFTSNNFPIAESGAAENDTEPIQDNKWDRIRLPESLKPLDYDVILHPHLENAQNIYIFDGNSTVTFECLSETDYILIHSSKLNYTMQNGFHAVLSSLNTTTPVPVINNSFLQEKNQYLVLELNGHLKKGTIYTLFTEFTGELAYDLSGFYRSEYKENGTERVLATTQMQPTDARKVFPCFDEPAMKAIFRVTLIHKPKFTALSNQPVESTRQEQINGSTWNITQFYPTKKMSTYLLAFVIGDFACIGNTEGGVLIRIWGRKEAIQNGYGNYALNVTGPVLKYFERYYNTSYPLKKSDQIALPDFAAGAMENWGLITYRETSLLYDPATSSVKTREWVTIVIAHELAHQWFGNLVTVKWWNDLWLNEGFATYVSYLGADFIEPSWNIKALFVTNVVDTAMEVDALATSHPLSSKEEEVNTPEEIKQLFNDISYNKGAAVIMMLSNFLTEPLFVKGLSTYLNTFAFGNTIHDDLWTNLQKVVDAQNTISLPKSIKEIMDTWTLQMGFPVVTVNTTNGEISQRHFLFNPESVVSRPSKFNYTWIVPVTWMKGLSSANRYWLENSSAINPSFQVNNDWLLLNINMTGYYRVNYDTGNWERLLNQLNTNHSVIPVINRAQIITDAFNLARAKHIPVALALNTSRYLILETEYLPWQSFRKNIDYFNLMFDRTEVYGPMKRYMRKQIFPLFKHFQNSTDMWTKLPKTRMEQDNQVYTLQMACYYGLPECTSVVLDLFRKWMKNSENNPILPSLRVVVYCYGIASGGEEEWEFAWRMFKNTSIGLEADKLRAVLSCTKEPGLLNRYLAYTLDPEKIRKQDAMNTIVYISVNPYGHNLAWDFIRAKWKYIITTFGDNAFAIANLIQSVTRRFSSEFDMQQLQQFKKGNEDTGFASGAHAIEQALERTKANVQWMKKNRDDVLNWFLHAS